MTDSSELTKYDSIVEQYITHTERPNSWNNLYERPFMLSKIGPLKGKDVLDLGCGSGFYTRYALEQGANVTAIDASQAMLDRLADIGSSRLQTVCADISKPLSFLESECFDRVMCSLLLHYLEDWDLLLSEVYRVMRDGAEFIISTHHPFNDYLHIDKSSYFGKNLVEDTWAKSSGHPFKVRYYTRSLTDVLQPIISSQFNIVSIEEPLPAEEIKHDYPKLYERLSKEPAFLFIVLRR